MNLSVQSEIYEVSNAFCLVEIKKIFFLVYLGFGKVFELFKFRHFIFIKL